MRRMACAHLLNQAGVTTVGARPTLASYAMDEVCAQTLHKEGQAAAAAVAANTVNDSLEAVVEANTLLSGLGFESGGVARSLTAIPHVHANHLHGEMVAILDAHSLGLSVAEKTGDAAYRRLHGC